MTLPHSGPISLAMIAGEFGGSAPYGLSNYYAGGPHVPSGTTGDSGPIPTSGAIKFSQFYGASNFSPHADDFTASGSVNVPGGATQLILEAWGPPGNGGHGATGGSDHQGGGGQGGGYSKSIVALSGDAGKALTVTIGAGSTTTTCALTNGGGNLTANKGGDGVNATGTTNGTGGTGAGTASGGNTQNTTGTAGVNGNSGGSAGQGGAAAVAPYGHGGDGGYTVSDDGRNVNLTAAHVRATWS